MLLQYNRQWLPSGGACCKNIACVAASNLAQISDLTRTESHPVGRRDRSRLEPQLSMLFLAVRRRVAQPAAAANERDIPSPIPLLPPVTITILPFNSVSMPFLDGVQSKIGNLIPLKLTETVERHTQTINFLGSASNTTPPQ